MMRRVNEALAMRRGDVVSRREGEQCRGRRARKRGLLLQVLTAAIGVMSLAFVLICGLAAHRLSMPLRRPVSAGRSPDELGAEFEEIRFPARGDRLEISGWFIPSDGGCRALVLVHGKDANRTRELDRDPCDDVPGEFPDLAVALSRRGFSVLMIDLRGHGQSGRARFGFGRTERLDVLGAVDWLAARGFRPGRIGVLGVSMGAATGIGAASEDHRIGALVADSSFAELTSLVEMHWTSETHLPALFLPVTKMLGKHWFGCDIDAARPVDEIGAIRRPILLIHTDADPITPAQHARILEQAAGDSAELWESRSDRHAGAYFVNPQAYIDKVAEFFDRHLN
jgi:dipeptidyl aminopeptidase/acylaminoacyl peptidase